MVMPIGPPERMMSKRLCEPCCTTSGSRTMSVDWNSRMMFSSMGDDFVVFVLKRKANQRFIQVKIVNKKITTTRETVEENEKAASKQIEAALAGWMMGLEPTTFGTTIRRSNQLSYNHRVMLSIKAAQR